MASQQTGSPGGRPDSYVTVTVLCGERQLDVALPATVPWADVQPSMLRLLLADRRTDPGRWLLTPVGRADIEPAQTLADAGVRTADVLLLHQSMGILPSTSSVVDGVRDRIEDLVDGRDSFWGQRESRRLALWAATSVCAALLVPATRLAFGSIAVGGPAAPVVGGVTLFAAVAVVVALIAVVAAHSAESCCAAICLGIGCAWAWFAGALAVRGGPAFHGPAAGAVDGAVAGPLLPAMVAAGAASALLLAGCCVAGYPAALVHAAALLVVAPAAGAIALGARLGASIADLAGVVGLTAVLAIGVVPRMALAVGGIRGAWDAGGADGGPADPADLAGRFRRADRLLTGTVLGLSLVAVAGVLPAAVSSDGWHRLFAVGLGVLLFLRSRLFSQVPQVLAVRIGALAVGAELWFGLSLGDPAIVVGLILVTVVVLALVVAGVNLMAAASPVAVARAGRAMDLTELALVAALVVLAAGLLGLSGWVTAVVG